jgi:hypothetical protein
VYVPAYRVSPRYVTNVNVTNTTVNVTRVTNVYNYYTVNNRTNITNVTYVNQHIQNGVTSVSQETFVNARPVSRNIVAVSVRDLEQAPVRHTVEAEPQRASVLGAGRPTSAAPPAAIANRRVVAERTPAPPVVPFNQRTNPYQVRPAQPPIRMAEPARQAPPREANQPPQETRGDNPSRPETPASRAPQPADNSRNESWRSNRPGQPVNQPAPKVEPARPEQGRPEQAKPEQARPEQGRPEQSNPTRENTPRAEAEQNQGPQGQPDRTWTHPLAKPAPPERPKTEPQMRDEESKFKRWEQQQKPDSRPPAQRSEKPPKPEPKKDEKKDHHQ